MSRSQNNTPSNQNISLTHVQVSELLHEYASEIGLGNNPEAAYPAVTAHLKDCDACRSELDELLRFVLPAYAGSFEMPTSVPAFSLASMKAQLNLPQSMSPISFLDHMNRLVIKFSKEILLSIQQYLAQPAMTGTYRSGPASASKKMEKLYTCEVSSGTPEAYLCSIDISVCRDKQTEAILTVQIIQQSISLEQPSSHVVVRSDKQILVAGTTDFWGCITFEPFSLRLLPQLSVEVNIMSQKGPC